MDLEEVAAEAPAREEEAVVHRPPKAEASRIDRSTGSVLLLVLVVIAMMTLGTGTYMVMMHNEHVATRYSGNRQQARLLAESGAEFLRIFLDQSESGIWSQGGVHDNTTWMQANLVADDAAEDYRGRYSVVAPNVTMGFYDGYRFGLEDESAKLNLNALATAGGSSGSGRSSGSGSGGTGSGSSNTGEQETSANENLSDDEAARLRLMALPGMTEEVADSILDWIDEDDQPRPYGAEESYYTDLTPAYEPRNGPLQSLDELLMVKGVTPELLYGIDSNRNFSVELSETPRGAVALVENFNGEMNRGWAAYLTPFGMEKLETPDGEAKIDVNGSDLEGLYDQLSPLIGVEEAKFIILCRQYGVAAEDAEGRKVSASSQQLDFDKEASNRIGSLLDLIGTEVLVQQDQQTPPELVASPWQDTAGTNQSLLELFDYATAEQDTRITGRVNINQASRVVLMSIPGMTETFADQIISRRLSNVDPTGGDQRHAIWIWNDGIVTLEEMKELAPHVTVGGDVYSCQIVGFFEGIPMQSRLEVVLDRAGGNTEILLWKELGSLGPGFTTEELLGIEATELP